MTVCKVTNKLGVLIFLLKILAKPTLTPPKEGNHRYEPRGKPRPLFPQQAVGYYTFRLRSASGGFDLQFLLLRLRRIAKIESH